MVKRKIEGGTIRAKVYPLLRAAVEAGIVCGYHRAYKHTNTPSPHAIMDAIEQAVMNEICDRFSFDGDDD